jgi:glutathione S-transferase
MPKLYDNRSSANCLKVRMLAGLLGLEHERVEIDLFAGETRTPEFLTRNPAGRVPVWETDDGDAIAESGAILLFLARGTALLPDDPVAQAQVQAWLFFEQNMLEPNVGTARFWRASGRDARQPEAWARHRDAGADALAVLERRLAGSPFLTGDALTVADIAVYAYTHVATEARLDLGDAVRAWIARVEAQPGVVNDLEPYPATAGNRPD